MKNVILASMLVLGVSAFAAENEMPASSEQAPAAQEQAPAPQAAKGKKAAKHGHAKKGEKKKAVEAHK
jgi:hypothetical protein